MSSRLLKSASLLVFVSLIPAHRIKCQSATFASLSNASGLRVKRLDIDASHSALEFSVRFMGVSRVRGAFAQFGGTIMYDSADARRSTVSVVILTKSINTNSESRDRDLRSPSFFDVEKYPLITFHSETIARTKTGFVARGPLTMHGVTKPVAIAFTQTHGLMSDAWGNKRAGFVGTLALNRKDYGILGTKFWNSEFDPGRMAVADNVDIELSIEADVNQVDKWTTPRGDSLLKAAAEQGLTKTLSEFKVAATDSTSPLFKIRGQVLLTVGTKLMHRGDYKGAADAFRLASELEPNADWAHAGLGEAYLMSGKRLEAVDSFKRAIAADSTNTVAFEYLRQIATALAHR
ncbi:MAG TPA: YceI family protein [Gemmatimonadaceae bacterium]|nr:YceI family protein [Gemmatimonadaceae bacterium]